MKPQSFLLPILVLISCALTTTAQDVKTDYDRRVDFTQYKTFSWEKVQTSDPLLVDRIQTAVNRTLAEKGWILRPSGGDVSIIAIEMTHNQRTLNTFYDSFGGGWGWRRFGGSGFGSATTTTSLYRVGTLVVDLFDGRTKKLMWRGSSSETLSNKSDNNIKKLDQAVRKMFDRFPPGAPKVSQLNTSGSPR